MAQHNQSKVDRKRIFFSQKFDENQKNAYVIAYMAQTYPGKSYTFTIKNNTAEIMVQM